MRKAILLTDGRLGRPHAKTAHGLIRGPSRYTVAAVVDPVHSGADAGVLAGGAPRGIPVVASLDEAMAFGPEVCVVGVATEGGVLPEALRATLLEAARRGLTLVNGLHQLLADDPELRAAAAASGAELIDLRRPRPTSELRFWTGEIADVRAPRLAVLGMDCAIGKRTTAVALRDDLRGRDVRAEVVYTGQTGWLQGLAHGFILDATPNDFVSGELERAVAACDRELEPDVILLEGQSSLRNPSGPCGAELVVSGAARGVVLQHAPARRFFSGLEARGVRIPPLAEEVALIRLLGAEVWAITLNEEGLSDGEARAEAGRISEELGLTVCRPRAEGVARVGREVAARLGAGRAS